MKNPHSVGKPASKPTKPQVSRSYGLSLGLGEHHRRGAVLGLASWAPGREAGEVPTGRPRAEGSGGARGGPDCPVGRASPHVRPQVAGHGCVSGGLDGAADCGPGRRQSQAFLVRWVRRVFSGLQCPFYFTTGVPAHSSLTIVEASLHRACIYRPPPPISSS